MRKQEDTGKGISWALTITGAIVGNLVVPGIGGTVVGGLVGSAIGESNSKGKKVAKIPVFYSFHFDNDVMRVQQVRNIGSIEGESPRLS